MEHGAQHGHVIAGEEIARVLGSLAVLVVLARLHLAADRHQVRPEIGLVHRRDLRTPAQEPQHPRASGPGGAKDPHELLLETLELRVRREPRGDQARTGALSPASAPVERSSRVSSCSSSAARSTSCASCSPGTGAKPSGSSASDPLRRTRPEALPEPAKPPARIPQRLGELPAPGVLELAKPSLGLVTLTLGRLPLPTRVGEGAAQERAILVCHHERFQELILLAHQAGPISPPKLGLEPSRDLRRHLGAADRRLRRVRAHRSPG